MKLVKIDRRDGIIAETFDRGSQTYADEYRRIRALYSDERGNQADRDFESALRAGQFATAGFVYKLQG